MAFISVKCQRCGTENQVDSVKEMGICTHCGDEIAIQEILQNKERMDEPLEIDTWKVLGLEAVKSRNFNDAERYANKIIKIELRDPTGWYIRGCCAIDEGAARECWEKALEYSSNNQVMANLAGEAINDPVNYLRVRKRQINIIRQKSLAAAIVPFEVSLGDKEQFFLKNGENKSFTIEEGTYDLKVRSKRSDVTEKLNVIKDMTIYIKLKPNFKIDVRIE